MTELFISTLLPVRIIHLSSCTDDGS
jgi:hypothetical protein